MTMSAAAQSPIPDDAEILALLERRIDVEEQGIGIVVGVVEPDGVRIVAHGDYAADDPRPVDGDTLFEIGSVAKVFTTLLLAEAVTRGEVRLDQPVAELLPEGVTVPERNGQQITLLHLATQRSGLPRLPDNFDPADVADPYADYGEDDLYAFLGDYELPRDIDSAYEYSNLGMGLLGHALAEAAGTDFETLLRERVLDPLGMDDTVISVPEALRERHAVGHDAAGQPVPDWNWDVLAGAGAMQATAADLTTFLSAMLGYTDTELAPAMALASEVHAEVGDNVTRMGLGWHIMPLGEDELVFHDGGTFGHRAAIGYLREAGVGGVVLSNMATLHGVTDLGIHLLDQSQPLVEPRQAIEVDPAIFDGLVGDYALAPEIILTVFVEDDRLMAQLTGQEAAEIFPESETTFFYTIVDAQITFETDVDGRANALILHQFGEDIPAPRVE